MYVMLDDVGFLDIKWYTMLDNFNVGWLHILYIIILYIILFKIVKVA